jgi:hypothetical protein
MEGPILDAGKHNSIKEGFNMKSFTRFLGLVLVGSFLWACSSTSMSGSWSSPEYKGQIKNIYVIGLSKKETNRRIFEDTFSRELANNGVTGVSSYKDLPSTEGTNNDLIRERMISNGTDSVLLTRLVDQRTETVTNPGRVSGYSSGSYYGGRGSAGRSRHYNSWGSYSNRRYDVTYQPATTTEFVVLTVESVLYDLKTEQMIWSAQLETVVEGNLEAMMQDFVESVTKDMKAQGMI